MSGAAHALKTLTDFFTLRPTLKPACGAVSRSLIGLQAP